MRTSKWVVGVGLSMISASAIVHGCGSSSKVGGAEGGPCYGNGTCNAGLLCLSQICVQATDGGGGGTGGVANGGAGGSAGAGTGGGAGMDCTASTTSLAPANGLIADFMGADGGLAVMGAIRAFPSGSAAAPTFSTTGGSLHITENAPQTSAAQYVTLAVTFGGCLDATAFTGVQFSISGSFSGCTMTYATSDVEHQDATTGAPFATGPSGSYQPQVTISASQLTSAPQTMMVPFVGGTAAGSPATPLDKKKLIFVFWQFNIPVGVASDAAPASCVADVTIDNVTFY